MSENKIQVLLVDDHPMLRGGLRVLLEAEEDIIVIGEAATGEEAVTMAVSLSPEVIVVDLGLPDISGFEVIKQIRAQQGDEKRGIVVLSMHILKRFCPECD